ncbi:MAG: hypothetical protein ABS888_00230 [Eubacteriales bacterium]
MAVDYNSPLGQVRLLIADLGTPPLLDDETLQGYLVLEGQNVLRTAATALDAMATSDILISRKIRTQDLQTDGPAVAAALRAQAQALRIRADEADAKAEEESFFDIIPNGSHFAEAAERDRWGMP